MENEALHLILRNYPTLLDQLKSATVAKREFTGVGFYTNFRIDDEIPRGASMQVSNVGCRLNNSVHVGLLLFVNEGKIDFLEGYTYGFEPYPEAIQSFTVFIEE